LKWSMQHSNAQHPQIVKLMPYIHSCIQFRNRDTSCRSVTPSATCYRSATFLLAIATTLSLFPTPALPGRQIRTGFCSAVERRPPLGQLKWLPGQITLPNPGAVGQSVMSFNTATGYRSWCPDSMRHHSSDPGIHDNRAGVEPLSANTTTSAPCFYHRGKPGAHHGQFAERLPHEHSRPGTATNTQAAIRCLFYKH
jgi:hypothetical protein